MLYGLTWLIAFLGHRDTIEQLLYAMFILAKDKKPPIRHKTI